ncbi:acyltransferase [Spirosoma sp.]|uniref:acyltransferase n=1 Tax=Spirosoma sp. TaxID=1899569 RepID=UPI00263143F8|nr:acyltransferase [Spirosoma sp.]MCX6217769.1 acyltransferase [Spirosoma sp.]
MPFKLIRFSFRVIRFGWRRSRRVAGALVTRMLFYLNNVSYGSGLESYGIPIVDINDGSSMTVGKSFSINSGRNHNRIGRQQPCFFIADLGGTIQIGNRVGMSCTALVCHNAITIGDDVTIGGNTVIYDTDFHSLDPAQRVRFRDNALARTAPVVIQNGVFIGAHVTILKGVIIGAHSVVAAGSVVTGTIPPNQIWGGNPAQFIRSLQAQPVYE